MLTENDTIYHYCSIDSFIKIMQTKSIWLSHVQTTNDKLDDRMFVAALKRVLKKHEEENHPNIELLKSLADAYIGKVDFPYIACFTHHKDLLSQWRAYGDDGKGVCIGFDLSKISYMDLLGEPHGSKLPIVTIDEIAYHDNDDELIEKILAASNILRDVHQIDNKDEMLNLLMTGLEMLSVFTKSEAFEEESEIRMVYFPYYRELLSNLSQDHLQEHLGLPIRFRSKGAQLVSYFEYPLEENSVCEIVLGPKSEVDYKQLTLFLNQYAPNVRKNNKITFSKISYR